jgi:hypothetical protein
MQLVSFKPHSRSLRSLWSGVVFSICWLAAATTLWAGGPRWVTGSPFFAQPGLPIVWYTNQPLYFTDPGDLSASVNHAAADAIVAAAAAVWNIPTSSLVLGYGGELDEHISGENVYPTPSGIVFPADVQSSNYLAKQIAIIYDYDGSITDLLLGSGASDPSSCRQNAVTGSVDSIVPAGYIQHAILVLNGRCTGPDPDQQLQMQYMLVRAFGRILGLGWSQTNDNVFTYSPQPTYNQAMNWPVMHPIDILCGPYTYQCMPEPFTLRADDISALDLLYFINQGAAPSGKTDTLYNANRIYGRIIFPTGQGMRGVNILGRRWQQYTATSEEEDWYTISSVSGFLFQRKRATAVAPIDISEAGSMGTTDGSYEGYFDLTRIPMLPGDWQNVILETEPINPLYTGQYAVGPYIDNTVEPSGSNSPQLEDVLPSYRVTWTLASTTGAANTCTSGNDGMETAPVVVNTQGWWTGLLCADGHTSWSSLTVKSNRTFTIEVAARDEQGYATTAKAMPVIGLWNASDPTGTLPTVASTIEAFNSQATGVTALTAQSTQPEQLRMAIVDQRGDGRPDYNYQARILYADSITPASVSAAGGEVTITGMGFRPGNAVTVDGVPATVTSWTANAITAIAPSLAALGSSTGLVADVSVNDLVTGGTTIMSQSLTYGTPTPTLNLVTAPSRTIATAQTAATPFAVQAIAADGVTPLAGQSISFTASGGAVTFGACGASSCTIQTDATGTASTTVTPLSPGAITLSATGMAGTVTASFTAATEIRTATPINPEEYIAAGATASWTPQISLTDNLNPIAGVPVSWHPISGRIAVSPSQSAASEQGIAQTSATAGPLAAEAQASISACAWLTVCATFTTQGVDAADLRLTIISGASQSISASSTFNPVVLEVTDTAAHPVAGAVVQIHQTIDAWQAPCPSRGSCPVTPTYASSTSSVVSDANGLVTVIPIQATDAAETTNIAAATGTQGFVSLAIQKQP